MKAWTELYGKLIESLVPKIENSIEVNFNLNNFESALKITDENNKEDKEEKRLGVERTKVLQVRISDR